MVLVKILACRLTFETGNQNFIILQSSRLQNVGSSPAMISSSPVKSPWSPVRGNLRPLPYPTYERGWHTPVRLDQQILRANEFLY